MASDTTDRLKVDSCLVPGSRPDRYQHYTSGQLPRGHCQTLVADLKSAWIMMPADPVHAG